MSIYFKVKPEYNYRQIIAVFNDGSKTRKFLYKNELLTAGEMKKYCIPEEYTEPVDIKRTETVLYKHSGNPGNIARYHAPEVPYCCSPDQIIRRGTTKQKEPETISRYLGRKLLPKR